VKHITKFLVLITNIYCCVIDWINYCIIVVKWLTGGPSGLRQSEPPHISKDPSTPSITTERQGRQAPSMSQLKRLDTRHSSHWLMQCERIRCHVCSAKNK